jgi:two-component system, LytTR family, sensor histidine kinase AlgZ
MNTKNTAYWACQLLGWGSYTVIGMYGTAAVVGPQAAVFIGYATFLVYSIGLTHLLRREIKRRGWLAMPFRKSIPRLLGASVLTGVLMCALVIGVSMIAERRFAWELGSATGLLVSVVMFTVGWTILYVAITSTRSALQGRLALREAELRALEGQVNPHFLFNCLNTIRGMISENPAQAQDMITRLANIFRYNLQQHREHTVPLSQEIEIVSDYLALEAIRFEDRLRVSITIDPAAANAAVPGMLLQTLVENALKHGLAKLPDGGEVSICASIVKDELMLRVENTGSIVEAGVAQNGTRVGLKNARERLRLLYGDRASLSLTNGDGRVAATVLIPKSV